MNSPAADGHHAELDEVVHRDGEVAVPADRQQRLGGHAVAGVAAEHGEQPAAVGQLQVELRMAGVELDLVGPELPGRPADQVDELLLVGGDRRPAHPLAADEGDEHLVRAVDVDVLDVWIAPQGVQLAEAVDVRHHGVEHRLMGVVGQRRQAATDASLVEPGELAMDLGDRGDLLGVGGHPRARVQLIPGPCGRRACRRCRRPRARAAEADRPAARRTSGRSADVAAQVS